MHVHTHHSLKWLSGYLEDKIFGTFYGASGAGTFIPNGYLHVANPNKNFHNFPNINFRNSPIKSMDGYQESVDLC